MGEAKDFGLGKGLRLHEWQDNTETTNRELCRLTEEIDPERIRWEENGREGPQPKYGVAEGTIRGVRRGENCTVRVAQLLVLASMHRPAMIDGEPMHIDWWTLYDL